MQSIIIPMVFAWAVASLLDGHHLIFTGQYGRNSYAVIIVIIVIYS